MDLSLACSPKVQPPAWSPDGKTIAFNPTRTGICEIWLMDADGRFPFRKQLAWDESLHVPFLINFPGIESNRGTKINAPITTPDILPSLLSLCNIEIPGSIEGDEDFNKQSLKLSGSHTAKGEPLTYEKNSVRALVMFAHWHRKYF